MDVTLISVVLAKTPSEKTTFHLFIHLHVFPYKLHGITGSLYIFFLCKLKFNLLLFLVAPFFTTYLPPYTGIQSKTAHKTRISAVLLYVICEMVSRGCGHRRQGIQPYASITGEKR